MPTSGWLLALCLLLPSRTLADDGSPEAAPPASAVEHGKAATADASPVDPGAWEVELGYGGGWNDTGGSRGFLAAGPATSHAFTMALTYGVAADVDVKLVGGYAAAYDSQHLHPDGSAPRRGQGLTDLALGARWRFLDLPAHGLEVAVLAEVTAPTGAPHTPTQVGLSQQYWSARGALVATKDWGRLSVNAELGLGAPVSGDGGGLTAVVEANLAAGWQVLPWLQPELELNYAREAGLGTQVLAATAGVVLPMGRHRVVAAVQRGLWGQNARETTSTVLAFKNGF